MSENTRHISNFLRRNQSASGLLEGVERDVRLLKAMRRALGEDLGPHCLYATREGERVCLLADGPVWAARLRFAAPELLAALCAQGTVAAEVRVRVTPVSRQGPETAAKVAAARLSSATIAHLRAAAAGMDDPDLAAALLRLAGAGGKAGSDQETARGRGA
jgi:hypothetical protein